MSIAEKLIRAKTDFDRVQEAGYSSGFQAGKDEGYNKGYHNGYEAGQAAGGDTEAAYQEGYADGKQSEYDRFWDMLQNYGAKSPYTCAFCNPAWDDETFKPKYTVYAKNGTFSDGVDSYTGSRCGMTDLRPETVGGDIDWSLCTNFNGAFMHTPIKYVGVVDMTNAQYGATLFYGAMQLEEVEKVKLPTRAVALSKTAFMADQLKEIRFEGQFKANVDMSGAGKLSHDSIVSAINALSQDVSGVTATFNKAAVNAIFTTDEWDALAATRTNWTITLV